MNYLQNDYDKAFQEFARIKKPKERSGEDLERSNIFIRSYSYFHDGIGFSFNRKLTLKELFLTLFLKRKIDVECQYKFSYKTKKWNKLKTQKHNKKLFNRALNKALLDKKFAEHYYKYLG